MTSTNSRYSICFIRRVTFKDVFHFHIRGSNKISLHRCEILKYYHNLWSLCSDLYQYPHWKSICSVDFVCTRENLVLSHQPHFTNANLCKKRSDKDQKTKICPPISQHLSQRVSSGPWCKVVYKYEGCYHPAYHIAHDLKMKSKTLQHPTIFFQEISFFKSPVCYSCQTQARL